MTCKELRSHFEDHPRDAETLSSRGDVAEHVVTCADCSRFVAEQRELGTSLREIRESAGSVPESPADSVLLSYRRHIAERRVSHRVAGGWFYPRLAWGFAALAIGILVVAVFLTRSRRETTDAVLPVSTKTIAPATVPTSGIPDMPRPAKRKNVVAKRMLAVAPERTASLPVRAVRSLPEGFHSLMYCDELSCPQDMEMIRVQLPSSAMPRQVSGFMQTSGSVTADVLVGPDGIARGIRYEEIEF